MSPVWLAFISGGVLAAAAVLVIQGAIDDWRRGRGWHPDDHQERRPRKDFGK